MDLERTKRFDEVMVLSWKETTEVATARRRVRINAVTTERMADSNVDVVIIAMEIEAMHHECCYCSGDVYLRQFGQ